MKIFVFSVDIIIDLITNSSSELFVFKSNNKEAIISLLNSILPTWREEYSEPVDTENLSLDGLNTYFSYACSPHKYPAKKTDYPVLPGFTFDELYELRPLSEWEIKAGYTKPYYYELHKNNNGSWGFVTSENRKEVIDKLDPERTMWFLFSEYENPDYEGQEVLETVAYRYHLG